MVIEQLQRVANPHRKKRRYRAGNPRKRKIKLSAKQIAAGFGGKRRQNATRRKPRRAASRSANPRRVKRRAAARRVGNVTRRKRRVAAAPRVKHRKRSRSGNPAPAIIPLGYVNPGRSKTMARRKRKAGSHSHRRRRKTYTSNPGRRSRRRLVARRSGNPRRRRYHRRGNPEFLGNSMEAVGILIGVAAQKMAKGFIPASLVSGNAVMAAGVSFVVAFAIGKGADMLMKGKPIGKGIALGALASAASDAISAFMPSLGGTIGLSGFGTYVNAQFAVPENPVMRGLPAPSVPVAAKGMGGALTAAFGHSF